MINGGFETGDFTAWTLGGNTGFSGVQCPGAGFVPEGNCDAFFGPVGANATLTQNLGTIVGQDYIIQFRLENDGGTPSFFSATFGASSLFSVTNGAATPFTTMTFVRTATSTTTPLVFSFRQDPAFWQLDAVSVVATPEPATMSLLGIGLAAGYLRRRRAR